VSVGEAEEGGVAEPRRPTRTRPPGAWGVAQQVSEVLQRGQGRQLRATGV